MPDDNGPIGPANCLGRTCLKWGEDGELTALDLGLILERVAQVDEALAAQHQQPPPPPQERAQ